MNEVVSTYAKYAIEQLLNVHALACMARSSDNREYLKSAAGWLPNIERIIQDMRSELDRLQTR